MKSFGHRPCRKGDFLLAGNSAVSCIRDTGSDLHCPLAKVHRSVLLALKINTGILIQRENAASMGQERIQLPAAGPEELALLQFLLSGRERHHREAGSIQVKKGVKKACVTYL